MLHEDVASAPEVPHMPWEEPELGFLARLWSTLGSTLHPVRDVARVSHGPLAPAVTFALLTGVPVAFAAGVLPLTELFQFRSEGAVDVAQGASQLALTLDVLRAGALGLAVTGVAWLVSSYAFVTLARSFAEPTLTPVEPSAAAWRVALYRCWLLPAGMVAYFGTAWLGPHVNEQRGTLLELAFHVLPGVIQMLNYSSVARYLGASFLAGMGSAFVPVLVFELALKLNADLVFLLGLVHLPETPPGP